MIRELNRSDVDVVAAYVSEALDGEFRKVGEGGYSPGEAAKDIIYGLENGWIQLIHESGGENVGFISGTVEGGEGDIVTLVVKEGHRRTGVGAALCARMMERFVALGAEKVNLTVHCKNAGAIAFFGNRGFTERTVEMSMETGGGTDAR